MNEKLKLENLDSNDLLSEIQKLVRLAYVLDEKYPGSDQRVVEKILEYQGTDLEYGSRSGLGRQAPIFATVCRMVGDPNLTFSARYSAIHQWYPNSSSQHPGNLTIDSFYNPRGVGINPDLAFTLDVIKPNRAMVRSDINTDFRRNQSLSVMLCRWDTGKKSGNSLKRYMTWETWIYRTFSRIAVTGRPSRPVSPRAALSYCIRTL